MRRSGYVTTAGLAMILVLGCDKGGQSATPDDAASVSDDGDTTDESDAFDESAEEEAPRGSIDKGQDTVLTVSRFEETVNERMQDVADCFSDAQTSNDKLGTKLVADFEVDGEGKVTSVEATSDSEVDDAGLLGCIKDKAQGWELPPPPDGEPTNFTFPFDFTPA
jgi:hypothetical protein